MFIVPSIPCSRPIPYLSVLSASDIPHRCVFVVLLAFIKDVIYPETPVSYLRGPFISTLVDLINDGVQRRTSMVWSLPMPMLVFIQRLCVEIVRAYAIVYAPSEYQGLVYRHPVARKDKGGPHIALRSRQLSDV